MSNAAAQSTALSDTERSRLDDAARAGWLYYIAGNTQDQIARKLNVSRATAQRLVSLSLQERLITFRLEHPIAACMELATRLGERFGLGHCEVVPDDRSGQSSTVGVAEAAAAFLEAKLRDPRPIIIALGTGRTLRAAVEQVPPMDCPNHQLVSLVGNISPDGSASSFNAVSRLADLTKARHFPMPLPTFVASAAEREQFFGIDAVRRLHAVAARADIRLVGLGQIDLAAPLHVDGFLSRDEVIDLMRRGAVGEITAWAMDAEGNVIEGGMNERVTSVRLAVPEEGLAVGVATGTAKVPAIRAALRGRHLNGLITNEMTAKALLEP
ncbi:sugar-binding transcriptional regulator [Labrys wisconsinensis]|uniref:DNA-binding transcriptional regulator LsrR (DeoR family) n=1 Tax=Labrys wisconsinensis TaxID=425677 RepID=A0ABU0JKG8_9HYPH|nr:sugar-binding transcriptional regulator [Labrys wisconsinensis]MDQ0474787.1 DNA-binding transcriptional regulator LsrR (DeoR family) [Labrys wisconsinensis]